ncbi:hypothetical protein ACJMK2_040110 [Sinanodonta woodiana]|uniref:NTR domain-containing protein n=1 Tax=Sinanodonta woodiana TaxID=1069815 RepID=A0ABD3WE12_SINWO
MEIQMMFAQCILVLIMFLHENSACKCRGMSRWEDIMCPNRDKTVVEGTVIGGQLTEALRNHNDPDDVAFCGGYTMQLEQIFKEGSNPLGVRNGTFFMVFPYSANECGSPFYGGRSYIVAGIVDRDGVLYSSTCQYISFSSDVSASSKEMDILQGRTELNCRK